MVSETGEFYEDEGDAAELKIIEERRAKAIEGIAELAREGKIPPLEMRCLECKGLRIMDYATFRKAPWYKRIRGIKLIRTEQIAVLCRRCKGTGLEKLSPADASQDAAAEA